VGPWRDLHPGDSKSLSRARLALLYHRPDHAHLVESGKLTLEDVKEAQNTFENWQRRIKRHDSQRLYFGIG
jgi:hypothetical protein